LQTSVFKGGGGAGAEGAEAPLKENLGGSGPPRFGHASIGNAAENWFGKIFQLEIFSKSFHNGHA